MMHSKIRRSSHDENMWPVLTNRFYFEVYSDLYLIQFMH